MEQVDRYWPLIEAYVAQEVLEARIDELAHLGFDKRLDYPILYCTDDGAIPMDQHIAELTKLRSKT